MKRLERNMLVKYQMLKERKVLKDAEQEPSIRVALRSIRDFAVGFKIGEDIYWRYILVPEKEVNELLNPKKKENKEVEKQIIVKKKKYNKEKEKIDDSFENPLAIKEKKKKERPES